MSVEARARGPEPAAKNKEWVIEDRRLHISKLYCQGHSQEAIGREIGVSQDTVSRDLRIIRDRWQAYGILNFSEKQAEELMKIDNLERVAWEAWHRSCEEAQIRRRRIERQPQLVKGPSGLVSKMRISRETNDHETKGRDGDDKFLARVAWCIETRLKLLGMLKDNVVNNTQVNVGVNWDEISKGRTLPDPVEAAIEAVRLGLPNELQESNTVEAAPSPDRVEGSPMAGGDILPPAT